VKIWYPKKVWFLGSETTDLSVEWDNELCMFTGVENSCKK